MTAAVLIVDDDHAFRSLVADILADDGYRLVEADSAESALAEIAKQPFDLIITDQRMPGMDGIELVRRISALEPAPTVILMTAYGTIPDAVAAVRLGAVDYLMKPLKDPASLRQSVRRALNRQVKTLHEPEGFLTRDPAMLEVLTLIDRAAPTNSTVLIIGESGTGKELLARRVHDKSRRATGPYVAVNAAAFPDSLADSEWFGHEKGSFTGATGRHQGVFERASGGTLFLDEVGELSPTIQAKMLRVLEEKIVTRVGGTQNIPVDVRVVAATHRILEDEVSAGRFRKDLFYRLHVVTVLVPALRERPEDVLLLADNFLKRNMERCGQETVRISDEAGRKLRDYAWPGNVRELGNILEQAALTAGDVIEESDIAPLLSRLAVADRRREEPPVTSLKEREKQAILEALEKCGGHREEAAAMLGVSVRTLYNRLKQFGLR